jgi:hypothetical protein
MKNKLMRLVGTGFISLAIVQMAAPAYAAVDVKSDGKASFVPQSGPIETVKPGSNEKITVVDGSDNRTALDNIQLMHVPDFNFGENETSVDTKDYEALYEHFKKENDATVYAIPQFVQVGDVTGVQGTKWSVTVEQDTLFTEANKHTLKNSRINIYNQTLTNSVHSTNVQEVVTGLAIPTNSSVQIPVKSVDSTGAVTVLASKEGKTDNTTTNGTISSVVFSKDYAETAYGTASSPAITDTNSDVKLNVPQTDGVQKAAYSAKLTWTLAVGP